MRAALSDSPIVVYDAICHQFNIRSCLKKGLTTMWRQTQDRYKYRSGKLVTFRNIRDSISKSSYRLNLHISIKMNSVKLYSWLCVSLLLICGVLSVQPGDRCNSKTAKPAPNPNDCNSYFLCNDKNVYVKINCAEALYFSAMHNQCMASNGQPCKNQNGK